MYPKVGGLDHGGGGRAKEVAAKPAVAEVVMAEKVVASPEGRQHSFSGRGGQRMKEMNGGRLGHVCAAAGTRCCL